MRSIFSMTLLSLIAVPAFALVDMKNANYSQTFVDMEVPGTGYDLKIVRSYQSRSLYNGMFGFGWCSDFETKLEMNAEGNIKVTTCGAGKETIYSLKEVTKKDVDASIGKIIAKMKADKKFSGSSDKYFKEQAELMAFDDQMRNRRAKEYGISNPPPKEGAKYLANGSEVENVIFNKTYYTRNLADGSYQRFNLDGELTHFYDKNGNFLKFEYEKSTIKEIVDNNARRLSFKYFPNKKVKQINGPNGLTAEYKYNSQDDLVWTRNAFAKKPTESYVYDYNEFHNMTKIIYPDKKTVSVKYDNIKDWVIGFVDRDNCTETYKYEFSPSNPKLHYWSTVKKVCGKQTVADNRFEFWHRQRSDGLIFLERVLTRIGGVTSDITYHEQFGKPISIRRNSEKMSFEYYPDGLIKAKIATNVRTDFQHDEKLKKPSKVVVTISDDKGKKLVTRNTIFKYDGKGNMTYAENSEGQKVTMTYDGKGRISSIVDQAKKLVKIEYEDKLGKPSMVTRPGLGTIKVTYKSSGEIQKVDSPEGPIVATQVASAFNNMLDIITPASEEPYL